MSKALVIIRAIFLLYCDLKCNRIISVCAFRFLFCLHYPTNPPQGDYEINARIYLPAHMYYLSFTRTSLRKCCHNADNFVKPVPSLTVYVLYFHFFPNKQLLIISEKKSDIKNHNKDHVNVALGIFFFLLLQGCFYFYQGWYFYQQRKKCVFCLFHDWLQRNSLYIHRWVFNTVSTSKARGGDNASGIELEK